MKKYLLLATVAGCVLTVNAWADGGGTADDGKSATVWVKANIQAAQSVSWESDVNFGDFALICDTQGNGCLNVTDHSFLIAHIDEDANVTSLSDKFVPIAGSETSTGAVRFSNTVLSSTDYTVTCADDSEITNGCEFAFADGSGAFMLKNIVVTPNSLGDSGYATVAGDLYYHSSGGGSIGQGTTIEGPAVKITVKY